jgi:Flp pilus assembly protein TadB
MDVKFEVQPNLCLVLWIVLNSTIVIGVSLVANVFILASWQTSKKKKKRERFFSQIPCALNCQLIRQKKKLGRFSSHLD